jgi:hypothetical protein
MLLYPVAPFAHFFPRGLSMNVTRSLSLAAVFSLTASTAFAFGLDDVTNAVNAASAGNNSASSSMLGNPQTLDLVSSLSSLNLSPQQAVGGTGAMLDLAKNQLPGAQYAQLLQSVPGLDQLVGSNGLQQLSGLGSILGGSAATPVSGAATAAVSNVNSLQDLNNAFGALGMDSSMIDQFTPLLLQYLGKQGADPSLLGSLGSLWGA